MLLSRTRAQARFVVLPPSKATVPEVFRNVQSDARRYDELLAAMQRFRGTIYRADGAIESTSLSYDGRHKMPIDEESWHVLSLDDHGKLISCLRYLDESSASGFHRLWVKHAAVSECPVLGRKFRGAVEENMKRAKRYGMRFGEVGGWAVSEDHRWTMEPLRIILATYGLLELLGGCTGVATATFRHSSAAILRRIGLSSIAAGGEEIPPYYDPNYRCEMEVLQFDSRRPAEKYRDSIEELARKLITAPVVCRESRSIPMAEVLGCFDVPAMVPAAIG